MLLVVVLVQVESLITVPLEVVGHGHVPVRRDGVFVSPREVTLPLLVDVVCQLDVRVVVHVVGVVGGVFRVELHAQPAPYMPF